MARRILHVKGEKCPRGHLLTDKTLRVHYRKSGPAGWYCLRCAAAWQRARHQKNKIYMTCLTQGG